jgi:hypothetical protein
MGCNLRGKVMGCRPNNSTFGPLSTKKNERDSSANIKITVEFPTFTLLSFPLLWSNTSPLGRQFERIETLWTGKGSFGDSTDIHFFGDHRIKVLS